MALKDQTNGYAAFLSIRPAKESKQAHLRRIVDEADTYARMKEHRRRMEEYYWQVELNQHKRAHMLHVAKSVAQAVAITAFGLAMVGGLVATWVRSS